MKLVGNCLIFFENMAQANAVCAKPNKSVGQMQASMCDLWPETLLCSGQAGGREGSGKAGLAGATRHFISCKLLRRPVPALVDD